MNRPLRKIELDPGVAERAAQLAEDRGVELATLVNEIVRRQLESEAADAYWRARASAADLDKALAVLDLAGSEPPRADDEMVDGRPRAQTQSGRALGGGAAADAKPGRGKRA